MGDGGHEFDKPVLNSATGLVMVALRRPCLACLTFPLRGPIVRKPLTVLAALATCLAPAAALSAQPADTLIWGGPVYTAEDTSPKVEAVAVTHGKISYAGTRAGAESLRGPKTQIINLKGAALFPGFTDSHVHLGGIGERELTLNLEGSGSAAEVVARLKAWMATIAPGEVVVGRGWIETGWPEKRFLSAAIWIRFRPIIRS